MPNAKNTAYKRVKGLTGNEKEEVLTFNAFCRLCNRRLSAGEAALHLGNFKNQCELFVHTDCAMARWSKVHSVTFRKDVKQTTKSKRTRTTKPKIHTSDGKTACQFCWKFIPEGKPYVFIGKKTYHTEGVNSCATRFRRVINATKRSLG